MVQQTKTTSTSPEDTPSPMTEMETKTVSISLQLDYAQILELALQLTKEDKEQLVKDLGESMAAESENKSEESRQQEETVGKDGKKEKQADEPLAG